MLRRLFLSGDVLRDGIAPNPIRQRWTHHIAEGLARFISQGTSAVPRGLCLRSVLLARRRNLRYV